MLFFKYCGKCGKRKFYVSKRSRIIPKVDRKPITTELELCGKCWRSLKRLLKKV